MEGAHDLPAKVLQFNQVSEQLRKNFKQKDGR
jgi:glutathionylspermidine synthase